jgi:hypothetical protein
MKTKNDLRSIAFIFLCVSAMFFFLGFQYPLLQSGIGIGPFTIKNDYVYLGSSFSYFFNKGEVFIGFILLFFTIIFPFLKYLFLVATLAGYRHAKYHTLSQALEIINKWAMLDVFVVAVLILNMKFDSAIIVSKLQAGTTLFAISIVLLMISSYFTKRWTSNVKKNNVDPVKG